MFLQKRNHCTNWTLKRLWMKVKQQKSLPGNLPEVPLRATHSAVAAVRAKQHSSEERVCTERCVLSLWG